MVQFRIQRPQNVITWSVSNTGNPPRMAGSTWRPPSAATLWISGRREAPSIYGGNDPSQDRIEGILIAMPTIILHFEKSTSCAERGEYFLIVNDTLRFNLVVNSRCLRLLRETSSWNFNHGHHWGCACGQSCNVWLWLEITFHLSAERTRTYHVDKHMKQHNDRVIDTVWLSEKGGLGP